jgi:hypothetical protein
MKEDKAFNLLNNFFLDLEFKKSNKSWYKRVNQMLLIIEYQKSRFDNAFYLNFGICIEEMTGKVNSPYITDKCQIYGRLNMISEGEIQEPIEIKESIEFTKVELEKVKRIILDKALPFLFKLTDYKNLIHYIENELDFKKIWIQYTTKESILEFCKNGRNR